MKKEVRDSMVKRVQGVHAVWPSFAEMPVAEDGGDIAVEIQGDPGENANYVRALYEVCAKALPVGRAAGDRAIIIGKSEASQ